MWTDKAANWIERVKGIIDDTAGLHHDLGTVVYRIERDSDKCRTSLEAGCAYRLIRLASAARAAGQHALGERAYALAAEVATAELYPSPDWATMCDEEDWPRLARTFVPFVHVPNPEQCNTWRLDEGETVLVRPDGVWAGGTPRRPIARQVAGRAIAAMLQDGRRGT